MAKPIKLSEEMKAQLLKEFAEQLDSTRMAGGTFEFKKDAKYEEKKECEVVYSEKAWYKTLMLIDANAKEVGWHGVCHRDEEDPTVFYVDDILVYPQKVTGTTINPDTIEYTAWMNGLDDHTFNNMRAHIHSHVNMGVTPSGTDLTFRKDRLSQLGDQEYYIFQIMNKSGKISSQVYDFENNILYETEDVKTLVQCDCEMEEWETYKTVGKLLLACTGGELQPIIDLFEKSGMKDFITGAKASVKEERYSFGTSYLGRGLYAGKGTTGVLNSDQKKTSLDRTKGQYGGYNKDTDIDDDDYNDILSDPFGYMDERGKFHGSYAYPCVEGDCGNCSNVSCAWNEDYYDTYYGGGGWPR